MGPKVKTRVAVNVDKYKAKSHGRSQLSLEHVIAATPLKRTLSHAKRVEAREIVVQLQLWFSDYCSNMTSGFRHDILLSEFWNHAF